MGIMQESAKEPPTLATTNEPTVAKTPAKNLGDQALRDAIMLVVACWLILFFLVFSLRGHNL